MTKLLQRLGAVAAVSAIAVSAVLIYAALTDQETVTDNTITTTSAADIGLSLGSGWIVFEGVTPGDPELGFQPLTVSNIGPDPLIYSMTIDIVETDGLGLAGHVTSLLAVDTGGGSCSGLDVLASGFLPAIFFGNPNPGFDLGDRTLAAGEEDVLCLNVEVLASAPLAAATDFSFVFDAERN